jgi:hypothetical protein
MTDEKPTRRTHWQAIANRKYGRLTFLGGDGSEYECWVVMTKCPHQQTRHWRYRLAGSQAEAEVIIARWTANRCESYTCAGQAQHSLWRLREEA